MLVYDPNGKDKAVFDESQAGRAAGWIVRCEQYMKRTKQLSYAEAKEYVQSCRKANQLIIPATMYAFFD